MKHNFRKLVAFACIFLSCRSIAQDSETFKITPEISQQILDENYMTLHVFPVVYKEIGHKKGSEVITRPAYLLAGKTININTVNGEFTILPGDYRAALSDYKNKYVKDELAIDQIPSAEYMTRDGVLIKKVGTDEYYYVISNDAFVDKAMKMSTQKEMFSAIHKLGYKEQKDEYNNYYIKSKMCEIRLNSRTLAELKRDPQYITKLDADQQKIATLVQQTIPHSKKLDQYLSTYNIKRSRMPAADLKAWRTATASAQKLQDQIRAISKKYDGNTSFSLLKKSNTQNEFLDNLLASKGVLGM